MGDPLSVTTSINPVLQLATSVAVYLRDVKDASKDCKKLVLEISCIHGILATLSDTISDVEDSDAWAVTIKTLAEPDGPLTILQTLLKQLEAKLSKCASATGFKKSSKSLLWPFSSKKTEEAVRAVERQKSLLTLALENDHILLSQEIRRETAALHTGVREIQKDRKSLAAGYIDLYKKMKESKKKTSLDRAEYSQLLTTVAKEFSTVFVVIDALDECDEDNRARLDFLKDIRSLQATVRIFATSRPIRSIEQDFQGAVQVKIHPQNADIDEFVQGRLESEPKFHAHVTVDAGLAQFIRDAVLEKCQGYQFRLAKLHMDALAKKAKCSKIAVINAASRLPSELNATYHDALERINGQHEEDSHLARQIYIVIRQSDHKLRISLHLAVELGTPAIVKALLQHGAEINTRNRWSEAPLRCAARRTNKIGVASLECRLDNDALVDPYDLNAITPLNLSAMSDNLQAVEILLSYRADVDGKQGVWQCSFGKTVSPLGPPTPLFSTVMNGNLDMIKMLLGMGAVVTTATRKVNSEFVKT
ncbi:hypothetical protein OEA41_007694 [Lepraria neglecta]|uniref:Nephrocystin 3-like N-terminal domain-containing protein n=1 Tax=Lepraria neglecta TaxID=209136 RepID=A0AAD9ZD57_9LECA|nr:hypothetical protein OEA41_007694 [Lepraria neglecta]